MGFDLARACWGRGYMREALKAAIAYGLADLGLRKVEAHTLLLNSRAIHLLKKLDFSVDGVVRESTWCNGRFQDEVFFSLERRDSGG
jgi:ribosomal-protein-alanine N-acetyltransferase